MPRISHIIAPALAASLALGIAAPAAAKDRDGWRGDDRPAYGSDYRTDRSDRWNRQDDRTARELRAKINDVARDINRAERSGLIRNAPQFHVQLGVLQDMYDRSLRRGINAREAYYVNQKADSLSRSLEIYVAQRDRRGQRFGYGYGYRR